jgi:hypothetical protein
MGRNGQPLAIFSQFRQGLALFVGKFKFHVLPRMTLRIRYRTLKTSRAVLADFYGEDGRGRVGCLLDAMRQQSGPVKPPDLGCRDRLRLLPRRGRRAADHNSPPAKIGVIVESAPHDRKRLSPNIAKASDPARNAKKPISGESPARVW